MIEAINIFTPRQLATASRISLASLATSIYKAVNARSSKCLRAQDKINWLFQMPLPDNQWEHGVLAWGQEGLAFLQATVQEYAAGPSIAIEGAYMKQMWHDTAPDNYMAADGEVDQGWKDMCEGQIVRDTQGTLNFSLLGIGVIFSLGILITTLSYAVEPLTAWVQKGLNVGVERANAWHRDDQLHTLRLLFGAHKKGAWMGEANLIPVTIDANEVFYYPEASGHGLAREMYQEVPNKVEDRLA